MVPGSLNGQKHPWQEQKIVVRGFGDLCTVIEQFCIVLRVMDHQIFHEFDLLIRLGLQNHVLVQTLFCCCQTIALQFVCYVRKKIANYREKARSFHFLWM